MNCIRGTSLLPASFIQHYLLHHHSNLLQTYLSLHSSQSSPSPTWLAQCFPFRRGLSETYQRLWSPLSPAWWYLSLQQRQSLRRVYFRFNVSHIRGRVLRHQLLFLLAAWFLDGSLIDRYRFFQIRFPVHVSRVAPVPRSGRFALTSSRLLMIHPSTLAVLPAPTIARSMAVRPARATTMPTPASV